MATVIIEDAPKGTRVKAYQTGGYGEQVLTVQYDGEELDFRDSANRVQIQVWSSRGTRWVNAGGVISKFNGNYEFSMPF